MSKDREKERKCEKEGGRHGGRVFACEPLVLIVLLQVSVSYNYSREAVAAPKVNITHSQPAEKQRSCKQRACCRCILQEVLKHIFF